MEIFISFYFWNFLCVCVCTPWAIILKTTLTEVDNVSFSAHPREWMGLSQLLVQKAEAADVRSYYF